MTCPICAYKNLSYPPRDYNICPCCSTELVTMMLSTPTVNRLGCGLQEELIGFW